MSEGGKVKLAVLIGGGGRLKAICEGVRQFEWLPGTEIRLITSYKRVSPGLEWARDNGYHAISRSWPDWKASGRSRSDYDAGLTTLLDEHSVDLVVLAGWGLLLNPQFIEHWGGRVINVHPALLSETFTPTVLLSDGRSIPVFRGNDAIEQALAAGADTTGCTVHYVTDQMDAGPILLKREIPIQPGDTLDSLTARIHAAEEALLPPGIALACQNFLAKK